MYVYKVMTKNRRNGIEYADSYWLKFNDATDHVEHMKLADEQEVDCDTGDEWHYWIVRVKVR